MLGYEPGGKAYRLYDPTAKCVIVSRDVVYEEGRPCDWDSCSDHGAETTFTRVLHGKEKSTRCCV